MKRLLLGLVVALVGLLGIGWGIASAHSFRSGNNTSVGSGEVVNNTLWVAGNSIDIAGQVNGDLFCAGQSVTISGTVRGDVLCAAQTITVSGTVTGNVRTIGQTVSLTGNISQNVSAAAQNFTQSSQGRVGGDAAVAASSITVNGAVGRDSGLAGQTVFIDGTVGRNVQTSATKLHLGSSAAVAGNLAYRSPNDAQVDKGATVTGTTTKTTTHKASNGVSVAWAGLKVWLYLLVAGLVVALALVLLFPHTIHAVTDHGVASFWKALLVGLVASILVPIIIVLLMITVIGIPLALLALLAWILVEALAGFMAAYYIGRRIWHGQSNPILIMLIGYIILALLYLIPFVNVIAAIVASLLGIGMILMAVGQRQPKPRYQVDTTT